MVLMQPAERVMLCKGKEAKVIYADCGNAVVEGFTVVIMIVSVSNDNS
jgi:hypothetical protein